MSASKYHWVNYTEEKLDNSFITTMAAARGSRLHEFAAEAIKLKIKLPRTSQTLNMYVNDAIGFKMIPEQVLYYSEFCFGTADAISFRDGHLRIHDLKTGVTPTKLTQLLIYAAIFCLEYGFKPTELKKITLRIYQNDEILEEEADVHDVTMIMDRIVTFDARLRLIAAEELE